MYMYIYKYIYIYISESTVVLSMQGWPGKKWPPIHFNCKW